ncbi:TM2 domain-containing protein [Carboxylicivirga sp. A043]|uniref:TM2 domain-containing protein n=1 Tax=Carboxylicivirga litoralis TaxID=2816963 RepID=UPI0021CB7034|nr:TM2 domain-containing protein [Carboxylicivirga sp. A043]MCU4155445.1 TM2 domain-containing protein [Carboxylicivirga sp. A043]
MNKIYTLLPEVEGEEAIFLDSLLKDMNEEQAQNFILIYRGRRKDPQTILLTALLGFFGFAGIHRFFINHIGMGILYFFTAGLCFIGTIVDLVNHKNLAFEHNQQVAREIKLLIS